MHTMLQKCKSEALCGLVSHQVKNRCLEVKNSEFPEEFPERRKSSNIEETMVVGSIRWGYQQGMHEGL